MQFAADRFVGLFSASPSVVRLGGTYLRGYIWDCAMAGVHFSFSGYFCALGRSELSFVHNLLSMLCVYGAFSPVVTLYSNLVISRGRSTINMVIGLLNCAFVWGGIIVLHALGYGLHEMVIFYVALNIAWLFVWQACARRLIGLRWWHALKDIAPFFVFALAVMAVAYFATQSLPISWLRMCLRIVIAVVLYVGSLWIARAQILRESIAYIFKKK
jgi:O-antigen/teichoic acid export membrane protein